MPIARKGSNPAPVPSRTSTAHTRVPQLRDQQQNSFDALDPFSRRNGPIPPQFADNVQYVTPKGSPKKTAKTIPPETQPQLPVQPSSSRAQAPASPSKKAKAKRKQAQKPALPAELVHVRPRTADKKSAGGRWAIELWILSFFAIYILAVCPSDTRLDHGLCRALDAYQSYIPYGYLRYKLDGALEHPFVAPVVHQTAPYYHKAVHASTPLVTGVQAQWKRHVVPAVSRTATRMERWATPYALAAADAWHLRVDPYAYRLSRALRPYRRQAEKYMVITLARMYTTWRAAEPRVAAAWAAAKTVPPKLFKPALEAWETWVDPPVRKMWARVEELAAGKGKTQRRKPQPTFGAFAQPLEDDDFEDFDEEVEEVDTVEELPAAPASKPPPPANTPAAADDVDSFLADLLKEDEEEAAPPIPPEEPTAEPTPSVSEEELARQRHLANVEKAKDKRAKFEADFKEWQAKLETTIKEQTEEFIKVLDEERGEVYRAFAGKDSRLLADVNALENELTLALKSMNAYLEKIQKEANPKELPHLWAKLVDKVRAKVEARIEATEDVVDELWKGVQNLEQGIINRMHEPVFHVSEQAQAQLGMPLAWLEDVTPADWKRFHDMKDYVKSVRQTFVDIQEGEHARSPADPIVALFKRTQADVQDILAGFEVQFNEIRRRGEAAFAQPKTADAPSDTIVPLIGRGKEEVERALRHEEL